MKDIQKLPCTIFATFSVSLKLFQNKKFKKIIMWDFPGGPVVGTLPCNAGYSGLIPGLERSTSKGNGNPFKYSCLENSMDRGA